MSGRVSFKIDLVTFGGNVLPELSARLKDLSPVFDSVIDEWAKDNADKFSESVGAEASGAEIDPEVFWERLTPAYMKQKRKQGYADQIMVRTGATKAALEDPEAFFRVETATTAEFGLPIDPALVARIGYNWRKRQAVFLSVDDQRMIERRVSDYFNFGPDFESIRFSQGLANAAKREASAQMDVDFQGTVE